MKKDEIQLSERIYNQLKEQFDYSNYDKFLNDIRTEYDTLYEFIILISDYIHSIKKSGHEYYFIYNYAGENYKPYITNEINLKYYNRMIQLFDNFNFENELNCIDFYDNLLKFRIEIDENEYINSECDMCLTMGEVYNEDEDSYEICPKCGGVGFIEVKNLNYEHVSNLEYLEHLDILIKPKLSKFEKEFNKYLKKIKQNSINKIQQILLTKNK